MRWQVVPLYMPEKGPEKGSKEGTFNGFGFGTKT